MDKYTKRVITIAMMIVTILVLLALVIPVIHAEKSFETDKFKNTGIVTDNRETLQYDVCTKLVYTLGDLKASGFERHPYINEEGITYKYNTDTKELYIDVKNE